MLKRFALALCLAAPIAAGAHDLARGPNGGLFTHVTGAHVEMVSQGTAFTLFVSDDADKPIPARDLTGRAVIQDGGKTSTVQLAPADPNKLTATLPEPLKAGARVVISVNLSSGQVIQARFVKD